jgi:O-antigen/teichoic acid export membrane protein
MVVRAGERSGLVMATRVLGRYLELALVVAFVVWIERSALSVFTGRLAAGGVLLAYFVFWSVRNLTFSRRQIDFAAMGAALMYGLPLMVNEFAGMVLSAFDRVLLKEITGDYAQVGIYTIGYALAMHINLLMNSALWEAFVPVANRVYGTEGEAAVRELKGRMLMPIVYASVGVATMVFAIGQDAIVALAGHGKAQSGAVFVVVGTMMALYPMFDISAYGLLLKKRSGTVLLITMGVTALNIGANFLLIPRFEYMGAAYAMVISHVVLWGAYFALCPRGLLRLPDLRTVATAVGAAAVLLGVIEGTNLFGIERAWPRVFTGGLLFLALYVLPVWLLDARLRAVLPKLRQGGA